MKTWTLSVDPLAGFVPMAADDWPIEAADRWPPGRLRATARMAYDHLAAQSEIQPVSVRRDATGAVIVTFKAKIPEAWVRDLLRRAEKVIMEGEA